MQNGDISNVTSPRIIVVADVVVESVAEQEEDGGALKRLFSRNNSKTKKITWNNPALSHLWRVADSFNLSVELVGYEDEGWTQEDLDKLMDKLDARGGNPFNYAQVYDDFKELVGELPYRANLKAVIDIRSNVMRYGSWGLELENF